MYIVITKFNATSKRIDVYQRFATEAEADTHLTNIIDDFPNAFVAEDPGGGLLGWFVDDSDPNDKTLSNVDRVSLADYKEIAIVVNQTEAGRRIALLFGSVEDGYIAESQKLIRRQLNNIVKYTKLKEKEDAATISGAEQTVIDALRTKEIDLEAIVSAENTASASINKVAINTKTKVDAITVSWPS